MAPLAATVADEWPAVGAGIKVGVNVDTVAEVQVPPTPVLAT
jgi:hypothetical protein